MQDYRLEVIWIDDTRSTVNFSIGVSGTGVLAPLLDPALFCAVRVGERARTIEWVMPAADTDHAIVDIDADALFEMSEAKTSGESAVSARG